MIHIKPGCRVHTMLTLFSIVNEFPFRAIHLLGNERVYQKLVWEYCHPQTFCLEGTDKTVTTKLFTISGKGKNKKFALADRGIYPCTYDAGVYELFKIWLFSVGAEVGINTRSVDQFACEYQQCHK